MKLLRLLPIAAFVCAVVLPASALGAVGGWSAPTAIAGSSAPIHLSCVPGGSTCTAVDAGGSAFNFDGTSWGAGPDFDAANALTAISCPTSTFCLAGDNQGDVFKDTSGSWNPATALDAGNPIVSVTCTGPTFCLVLDNRGDFLTFNGLTWTGPTVVAASTLVHDASCVSSTFCVAAISNGTGGEVSTYNGASWNPFAMDVDASAAYSAISCTSTVFCVAVGVHSAGGWESTWNGINWSSPIQIYSGAQMGPVSCVGTTFCLAVTGDGNAVRFENGAWTPGADSFLPAVFDDVSCSAVQHCVATVAGSPASSRTFDLAFASGATAPPAGTAPAGQAGTGTANTGASADTTRPVPPAAAKVLIVGKATFAAVIKAGAITLVFPLHEKGLTVTGSATLKLRHAKAIVIARGASVTKAPGTLRLKLMLTKAGKAALRHAKKPLKLTVTIVVRDRAGNVSRVTKQLTLNA